MQDRLQLSRLQMPLDKWSVREQLCLASAVSSSGDQNWMSVSRTLKMLCGGNGNSNRPADFFSQKSCAVQYGALLENVETPKRKKREQHISGQASPVETPTDLILRRLTEERIQELKVEMRRDQEEYASICGDVRSLQGGDLSDERILEMWQEIEKQQEQQRIEEMKLENQLREREQRRQELQRSWRHSPGGTAVVGSATPPPVHVLKKQLTVDATADNSVNMDIDEGIGVANKPSSTLSNLNITGGMQQQQQQTGQTSATSPLLSSLLKSPTSATAPSTLPTTTIPTASNSARTTAPTITTLLTSGAIPNPNQPAIVLKKLPPEEAAQLLARPISGPPTESLILPPANAQNLLSPSQSAPTLSMLLEKNKNNANITTTSSTTLSSSSAGLSIDEAAKGENVHAKPKVVAPTPPPHATDFNNEEVPMDIEEDVATTSQTPTTSIASNPITGDANTETPVDAIGNAGDSDETDPNEEQQLMEVFKNIGNIEELGIDVADVIEEVDFLKGVDEEPTPNEAATESMDFEIKLEVEAMAPPPPTDVKTIEPTAGNAADVKQENEAKDIKDENLVKTEIKDEKPTKVDVVVEDAENAVPTKIKKVETSSSDDSNDNIPLAAVASLEHKERTQTTTPNDSTVADANFLKENLETVTKNDNGSESDRQHDANPLTDDVVKTEHTDDVTEVKSETDVDAVVATTITTTTTNTTITTPNDEKSSSLLLNPEEKSSADSESSDVIVIPTDDDDESISEKNTQQEETLEELEDTIQDVKETKSEVEQEEVQNEEAKDIIDEDDEEDVISSNTLVEGESCVSLLEEKSTDIPVVKTPESTGMLDTKANHLVPPLQTTISIADTDDSSATDISVATTSTIRRENEKASSGGPTTFATAATRTPTVQQQSSLLRKNQQDAAAAMRHNDKTTDEESTSTSSAPPARPPMLRKLRDRDRSESPMIDDENTTASDHYSTNQRSRRRYSSTPVIDSIPSSPASSDRDERETRSSKKLLLSIFNALQHSKNAAIIQRAFNEDHNKHDEICLKQIDLHMIKKNIEGGITRSVHELQRDIMLMCQNAIMVYRRNTVQHKAAIGFLQELQGIREFMGNPNANASDGGGGGGGGSNTKMEKELKDGKFAGSGKGRAASRKSQRIS